MALPTWIEKYKKPKTEIRFIKGTYYMYSVSYKYSPEKKRTMKITGKLLGKITESEGFIKSDKDKLRTTYSDTIHVSEYGCSQLFLAHMETELSYLESCFAETQIDWKQIAAVAMMRWIYRSPIKMMDFHWQNTYHNTDWKVSLGDKQISKLLRELGDNRYSILNYFQNFPINGGHLLIDTTNIPSKSESMESVIPGYNHRMSFYPQTNLFFIFSTKLQLPIYYRVVPGNIRDVKSFSYSLLESGISDAVIVADKGFYSRENIELLKESELKYIIPLRRSSGLINYQPLENGSKREMTDYFEFDGRVIWYYENKINNERIITFNDDKLKVQETQDYLRRTITHPEEYTKETFFEKQFEFGTLSFTTNLTDTSESIYQTYKCRGQIEQVFDSYKNFLEADKTYMQNDKALDGWSFVNFLAIQAYYKLYKHMKKNKESKKYSVEDILHIAQRRKKLRLGDKWVDAEITKKNQHLFDLALPVSS